MIAGCYLNTVAKLNKNTEHQENKQFSELMNDLSTDKMQMAEKYL